MISLTKAPAPEVLRVNGATWTQVLVNHRDNGTAASNHEKARYRHPEIKQALVAETHGKCAYCESKIRHIAYGDVEHIVPKSTEVERTFEWANLTLACDVCNTNKSDHFGNHDDLVDPYVSNPTDHLAFIGAMVMPIPGSNPGMATVDTLELNRIELVERRAELIQKLCKQLHLLLVLPDEGARRVLERDLNKETAEGKEYSAIAKSYVESELRRIGRVP